jgi:hypothetical protein
MLATRLAILCRAEAGITIPSAHLGTSLLLDNHNLKAGFTTPYARTWATGKCQNLSNLHPTEQSGKDYLLRALCTGFEHYL